MKVEGNQGNVQLGEVSTDNPMVEPPGAQEPVEEPTEPETVEDPPEGEPEGQPEGDEPQAASEEYTPDLSYKVFDEQREFPEYVRSIIKDKESEDQIRSLFCKAEALEPMKEKLKGERTARENWENKFQELDNNHHQLLRTVQEADHYAKNDLASLFKFMNIPRDAVLKYAAEQLQYEDLPADQRQLIDQRSQQTQQSFQYQTQLDQIQSQNMELMRQQHDANMSQAMSEPEIASFKKVFEEKRGEGSFLKAVNDYGDAQYLKTQQYVSPHQAVRAVYEQYSGFLNTEPTPKPGAEAPQAKPHTPPAALPSVGRGGGASPIKKVHKSLDELREYARQYQEG